MQWNGTSKCQLQKETTFAHNCFELLEHSEKWKLREQEAPSVRGSFFQLDNNEHDELTTKNNKEMSYGTMSAKDRIRKQAEASTWRDKVDEMMKSKEHFFNKTLEAKMVPRR